MITYTRWEHFRNELTRRVCNFMIKRVAAKRYGTDLTRVIVQGMYHAETGEGPFIGRVHPEVSSHSPKTSDQPSAE